VTTPDTSVVVAAFARWHEHHDVAADAIRAASVVAAHVAVETYSVLTRLPAPRRVPPALVADFLELHFAGRVAGLDPDGCRRMLATSAAERVAGGAVYDALVAATAREADATLVTLDRRAVATYRLLGADYRLLA
jgi:predicted nucleic acid-binding protein